MLKWICCSMTCPNYYSPMNFPVVPNLKSLRSYHTLPVNRSNMIPLTPNKILKV